MSTREVTSQSITPRKQLVARTVLAVAIGLFLGGAGYTFFYAKGYSYLSDDPSACANCHIMNEQYDGWIKSSHHAVATCNDCHTPASFVGKYATKASHGFWHSYYFTTDTFHEPIRISPSSLETTEAACLKCHSEMVESIGTNHLGSISCVRCHQSVGHLH